MASVYIRPNSPVYWMRLPGKKREPTGIPHDGHTADIRRQRKREAEDVLRARMTELVKIDAGLADAPRDAITFTKYAAWYTTHKIAKRRGADRELTALDRLLEFFGRDALDAIDAARVDEYETKRGADTVHGRAVTPSAINREVDVLKSMLRDAVPKYLKASPIAGRPRLRTVKRKKRIVANPGELARLLAAMPDDSWRRFYVVAHGSLMRLANVVNLRRDEDHGTYFALADSKTGPYDVPIAKHVRRVLDDIPHAGPYYFPERRVAKTYRDQRGAVRLMLRRAAKRAGIPYGRIAGGITWHTATRATGATWALRNGHDLKTVQAAGNWSDLRAMQEYLHADRDLVRDALDSIGPDPAVVALPARTKKTGRRA
jgi:Phage integrase family